MHLFQVEAMSYFWGVLGVFYDDVTRIRCMRECKVSLGSCRGVFKAFIKVFKELQCSLGISEALRRFQEFTMNSWGL